MNGCRLPIPQRVRRSSTGYIMQQVELKNGLLIRVRDIALKRLARLASTEESMIRQAFLFATGDFCGVRFEAGPFQARWLCHQPCLEILREQQVVDRITVAGEQRQAA